MEIAIFFKCLMVIKFVVLVLAVPESNNDHVKRRTVQKRDSYLIGINASLEPSFVANDTKPVPTSELQCVLYATKVHYALYLSCTILSVAACLAAFYVYAVIRKVRDIRLEKTHWINWNFMISFILRDAVVIVLLSMLFVGVGIPTEGVFSYTPYFIVYVLIANFYWMFAEGLWLYLGVIYPLQFRSFRHIKVKLSLIGWITPGILTCAYAVTIEAFPQLKTNSNLLDKPYIILILTPIFTLLVLNLMLMIRVLHKLSSMVHTNRTSFANSLSTRWLAKSTIALVLLLGIFFLIPGIILNALVEAKEYCAKEIVHTATDAITALQGVFVAFFYILGNEEVRKHTGRRLKIWSSSLSRDSSLTRQSELVALAELPK